MWKERKVEIPAGAKPEDLIKVPENAQYFAALGAVEFGKSEDESVGCYHGHEKLVHYIEFGRQEEKAKSGARGLTTSEGELEDFNVTYAKKKFTPAVFNTNQMVSGFIGIDGGSTSTKAVLLDEKGDILCKAYQLSNGNPIQDTIEMFENLREQVEVAEREARSARRRDYRLCERYFERRACTPMWRWWKPSRTPNRR